MKTDSTVRLLWLLMLHSCTNQEAAAAETRVVRSDEVPTELSTVVTRLSQRLDALEAENQVLKNDFQTVKSRYTTLELTMVDLWRAMGTTTMIPPSSVATTPSPAGVSLESLKQQVDALHQRGDNMERQLQDLQNGTDLHSFEHTLKSVDLKYQLMDQIVYTLKQKTSDVQSNVTRLQTYSQQLQQQLHNVTQMVTTSQNINSSIAAMQTQVDNLVLNGNHSQQNTTPAVAFDAHAGDAPVELASGATVVLREILTSEHHTYNRNTGKALITVDGLYLFLVTLELKGHEATLHIKVNGQSVAASHLPQQDGPGSHDSSKFISMQTLVRLHAGDSVWVQASSVHHDGVQVQPGQESSFIGLLLHT